MSEESIQQREPTPAEVAKWEAEADKALAEAQKARSEARKADAEAEFAEHNAAVAELDRERAEEKRHRERLADDFTHHVYQFYGDVDGPTVTKCISQLKVWDREDPECDLEVVFFSPGGGVFAGMQLFDFLGGLRETHKVTTMASGYAASMAGILVQAGDVRAMTPQSYLMVHEISTMAWGKASEIADEVEFMKKITDRVLTIFADRAAATDRPKAISKAKLRRLSTRKDAWLSSQECYDFGIVDEIR